jgi:hypothetical protein
MLEHILSKIPMCSGLVLTIEPNELLEFNAIDSEESTLDFSFIKEVYPITSTKNYIFIEIFDALLILFS